MACVANGGSTASSYSFLNRAINLPAATGFQGSIRD
jgi:hypothetical protein